VDTHEHINRLNAHIDMERAAAKEAGASLGLQVAGDQQSVEMTGNTLRADTCSEGPKAIRVALGGGAADTLRCLFFHGPTWDGNVPSKSGRDELVNMGLAARSNGWQWLTRAGVDACFANGIHDEKDRRESRDRLRRIRMEEAARRFLGE
jgi:hypothetical protein